MRMINQSGCLKQHSTESTIHVTVKFVSSAFMGKHLPLHMRKPHVCICSGKYEEFSSRDCILCKEVGKKIHGVSLRELRKIPGVINKASYGCVSCGEAVCKSHWDYFIHHKHSD